MAETFRSKRHAEKSSEDIEPLGRELGNIADYFQNAQLLPSKQASGHHGEALETALKQLGLDQIVPYEGEIVPIDDVVAEAIAGTYKLSQVMHTITPEAAKQTISPEGVQYSDLVRMAAEEYRQKVAAMKWQTLSLDEANYLLGDMYTAESAKARFYEEQKQADFDRVSVANHLTSGVMSSEMLRALYNRKDSSLKKLLGSQILANNRQAPLRSIVTLSRVFGESGIDTVQPGEDQLVDHAKAMLRPEEITLLSIPEKPTDSSPIATFEFNTAVSERAKEVFDDLGLDHDIFKQFWLSSRQRMMQRTLDGEGAELNSEKVKARLQLVRGNVKAIGVDRIHGLRDKLGTTNLDLYSRSMLTNLHYLAIEDSEHIEQINRNDVTVVFMDGRGDYNGGFEAEFHRYQNSELSSMLPFEVHGPEDITRLMDMLKRLGIKPSTLVIAGHGQPGYIQFGDALNGFQLDQEVIAGFVNNGYMQPNKTERTADELKGRIQIILDACSSDKQFDNGALSTAESVLRKIGRQDVDVYGATDKALLDGSREKGTLRLIGADGEEISSVSTKLSLSAMGRVRRRPIDVIPTDRKEIV
ncbi:MAG: hypothetical protein JWM52_772 [Candidatus Saccharibacteria bacterium]|nr:hypothetical protein [Candidatus Saccharibacteria bacterium]